mgnify:CR=1 FL=1
MQAKAEELYRAGKIEDAHAICAKMDMVSIKFDLQNLIEQEYSCALHYIFVANVHRFQKIYTCCMPLHKKRYPAVSSDGEGNYKSVLRVTTAPTHALAALWNYENHCIFMDCFKRVHMVKECDAHKRILRIVMGPLSFGMKRRVMYVAHTRLDMRGRQIVAFSDPNADEMHEVSQPDDEELELVRADSLYFLITQEDDTECSITCILSENKQTFVERMSRAYFVRVLMKTTLQRLTSKILDIKVRYV